MRQREGGNIWLLWPSPCWELYKSLGKKLYWNWTRSCFGLWSPCVAFSLWHDPPGWLYHVNCQLQKKRKCWDDKCTTTMADLWQGCVQLAGEREKAFFRDSYFLCCGSVKSVAKKMCIAFLGIGETFSADIKVVFFASLLSFLFPLCIL